MSELRKRLTTGIAGAMLGVVLAIAAPPAPTAASASLDDCECYDVGSGSYMCKEADDGCRAGSDRCIVSCY